MSLINLFCFTLCWQQFNALQILGFVTAHLFTNCLYRGLISPIQQIFIIPTKQYNQYPKTQTPISIKHTYQTLLISLNASRVQSSLQHNKRDVALEPLTR